MASLSCFAVAQHESALCNQCRTLTSSNGDDRDIQLGKSWQQFDNLGRLATVGECQYDIMRFDAAQVAVNSFGRVKEMTAGPG